MKSVGVGSSFARMALIRDLQYCFRFSFLACLDKDLGELVGKLNGIRIGVQSVAENAFGIRYAFRRARKLSRDSSPGAPCVAE